MVDNMLKNIGKEPGALGQTWCWSTLPCELTSTNQLTSRGTFGH